MNLSKHPLLLQCYNVMQAIEKCGASRELTEAVTMAGDLLNSINAELDCIALLKPPSPIQSERRREQPKADAALLAEVGHLCSCGWPRLDCLGNRNECPNRTNRNAPKYRKPIQSADTCWLIFYEDNDVRPEIFSGEGAEAAAKARYEQAAVSWNCHLFQKIAAAPALPASQSADSWADDEARAYRAAKEPK